MRERRSLECELTALLPRAAREREASREPTVGARVSPWKDGSQKTPTRTERCRRDKRLSEVILPGLTDTRRDAHSKRGTGLFAGSWDWHSCVHGHWALLCMARVCGFTKLERTMLARVGAAELAKERKWLRDQAQATFELPYGRAWLLLMLDELGRRRLETSLKSVVGALRDDSEDAVVDWLKTSGYPESGTEFIATHQSWLFALMLLVMSRPTRTTITRELPALRDRANAQRGTLARKAVDPQDFLFLPAVQAVLDRIGNGRPSPLPAYALEPAVALAPAPLDDSNEHSAGAAMVRLWPHALRSAAGNARSRARVAARMAEMFARSDQWKDDFKRVGHWVPQFMWMTEWLELGRP
jgi:hypothetical protein